MKVKAFGVVGAAFLGNDKVSKLAAAAYSDTSTANQANLFQSLINGKADSRN